MLRGFCFLRSKHAWRLGSLSYPVYNKPYLSVTANVFLRNVLLWSEMNNGIDPESTQGNNNMAGSFERFSLPGARSYGFGLSVKF